ncbi:MAG TPA: alpha/beta fold hydrolase [Stellaceae bacterium]|nr:alpha/beta fold hydrolase [Stellaceae bacterium]
MRRAAILSLMLALAACAGLGIGPLPRRPVVSTEPELASDAFHADDGARLPLREWLPHGPVKATILALHGFNDYSNAFAGPAAEWAEHGIATYAYDQRGFGEAPDRGYWVGAERLDQDVAIASRLVARSNPGVPHYILGESMGGAIAITAAAGVTGAAKPIYDGLILSAPAVWGRATMNLVERVALWSADTFMPGMTLTGQGLHILPSDNIAMLHRLAADPLEIKATRVDAIEGLVDLMDLALAAAPKLHPPILFLYGAHDELIPPEPVREFLATLPPSADPRNRVAFYRDGYHMLLRDLEAPLVIRDVESWALDPAAPLPSGADRAHGEIRTAHD